MGKSAPGRGNSTCKVPEWRGACISDLNVHTKPLGDSVKIADYGSLALDFKTVFLTLFHGMWMVLVHGPHL